MGFVRLLASLKWTDKFQVQKPFQLETFRIHECSNHRVHWPVFRARNRRGRS